MTYSGFDLSGRVAAITGSTSGMGFAIARGLAQCGAKVIVSSNIAGDSEMAASKLRDEGLAAAGVKCDIMNAVDAESFAERAAAAFGPVDILMCLAAGAAPQGPLAGLEGASLDALFTTVRNDVLLIRKFLPVMAERKWGSVVLMSSIAAERANPVLGAYGASKAALNAFVRSIAAEWGVHNIRANAIAPGMVRTAFSQAIWSSQEVEARIAARSPLNRIAEPDDVVGLAILLASPAGSYISGQSFLVDGGRAILGT